jgi:hypothetical protein
MAAADKWTVARTLDEIGQYIALNDPKQFKSRAFERAARAVEGLDDDIGSLVESGAIYATSGIGKSIGPIIEEIVRTGTARYLEELRQQYPPGIFEMLRVPSLGLTKIGEVYSKLGVGSLDDLEAAAREGRLAKLRGFGAKTEAKILEGIEKARQRESKFLLPTGLEVGEWVRAATRGHRRNRRLGDHRKRPATPRNHPQRERGDRCEGLRIAAGAARKVVDRFEEIDERTFKGVARREIEVIFHLAKPKDFGEVVLRTTGSRSSSTPFSRKRLRDREA